MLRDKHSVPRKVIQNENEKRLNSFVKNVGDASKDDNYILNDVKSCNRVSVRLKSFDTDKNLGKKFSNKRHLSVKNVAKANMKMTNDSCTNTIDKYFNRIKKSDAIIDDKVELVDVEKISDVESIRIDEPKSEKSLKVENALTLLMMKYEGTGLPATKERKKRERKSSRF